MYFFQLLKNSGFQIYNNSTQSLSHDGGDDGDDGIAPLIMWLLCDVMPLLYLPEGLYFIKM